MDLTDRLDLTDGRTTEWTGSDGRTAVGLDLTTGGAIVSVENFTVKIRALQQCYEEAARLDCSSSFCCKLASVSPPGILAPTSSTYDRAAVATCLGFHPS
ncbi:hypothetical protein LWI28_014637 [Acer negundo]|uniref:Uncharacterized protein n=1 Tax=Acer negundo TaxID=4023 RepID=A0AAD5J4U3_ACENE|nr:hypothetical protein LWI28_014637 [Acer negundo]